MKHEVVWIDRGWQPVAIGFCPTAKAWQREMKRLKITDSPNPYDQKVCGMTRWFLNDETGEGVILVAVNKVVGSGEAPDVLLTIVHEAVHVWQFLREHIGETAPGLEMEAYGIQHITHGLVEAFAATSGKGIKWL